MGISPIRAPIDHWRQERAGNRRAVRAGNRKLRLKRQSPHILEAISASILFALQIGLGLTNGLQFSL
jgi:hypothetical protein